MQSHVLVFILSLILLSCQSTTDHSKKYTLILPHTEEFYPHEHRIQADEPDTREYQQQLKQRLKDLSLPDDTISVDDLPTVREQIQIAAGIIAGYIKSRGHGYFGEEKQLSDNQRSGSNAFVYGLDRFDEWLGNQGCISRFETSKLSGGVQSGWSLQLSQPPQMPLVVHFLTREKGEHRETIPLNLNLRTEITPLGMDNNR
jgi:hypothetical protein